MSNILSTLDPAGLELMLPAVLLLVAIIPFLGKATRLQAIGLVALPIALTAALGVFKYTIDTRNDNTRAALLNASPAQTRLEPLTAPDNNYTSSQTCRACHPSEYRSWHNSYHRTMTQLAKPGAILAKWHGSKLPLGKSQLLLEEKHGEFWVTTIDEDGTTQNRKRISMTTGSHHLQVYWTADTKGNTQHPFPYGWLIADRKWAPVEDTFLHDPNRPIGGASWNDSCIKCHSVAGRPAPDSRTRTYHTETAELGIACEACHGPAGEHIAHYQNPAKRYLAHMGNDTPHGILNPSGEFDHRLSTQVCGQCHAYQYTPNKMDWLKNGPRFLPGNPLKANTTVVHASSFAGTQPAQGQNAKSFLSKHGHPHPGNEWLKDRFWPDGMVRVTGREYNGLLDTPCHQRGKMSCLSCHSMHGYHDNNDQLAPRMDSNDACFQCHGDLRNNLTEHTHHDVNSTGSRCYNCHMPHTTYGLLGAIRSHQIDSPNVTTQLNTGRPNACNLCHLDRTLGWTSNHLAEWYGHPEMQLDNDEKSISSILKMLLQGDAGQRAIAAWHMGWKPARSTSGSDWQTPWLISTMDDPYAAVRHIAHKALKAHPYLSDMPFDYTAPLAKRAGQIDAIRRRWATAGPFVKAPPAELLLDVRGHPLEDAAKRLTTQRDNRPMTLQE